ncbi:acyl-CoA dehydrogenase family protein [Microtetraspora sp. NBRC 16547]|uniref:acyl-CoA dehydrogenase family protein n=1 Tax=Microtetraspora sp. NBRC 16547 TaxID=3030993 RepID=UPI0024A1BC5F|nr:acyl-CoA dehydrogenase family protein [Microtetraspora sp. NBRC 16547]GLW99200.1 putative acyl-CoA dehydrogenase [Microtetraspora sp. NBRC 16547]
MNFTLDEELEAIRDLARKIFADRATTERVREVENSPARVDESLWAELGKAGLLGIAAPEEAGGAGLGLGALCVLLEEQGRVVAPVPLWAASVGALAIAAHGTAEQRESLLPGFVEGSSRLTVALEEFGPYAPGEPQCVARCVTQRVAQGAATKDRGRPGGQGSGHDRGQDGDGWRLTGVKAVVPSPFGAGHVLVAARAETGTGLFLVAADADGVTWERAETTSHDLSANLILSDAPAQAVGEPGTGVLDWAVERASVALAAVQLGVAQGALRLAAGYLSERKQFGRPLATFQAVQHQLADCYIDIEAMGVALWQAVTTIEEGEPAAAAALVAKWWAGEAGLNVVHRVQHVHGGIGVDVDYPVHRYFLWGKQIAGTLGGAGADLARLGTVLAAGPVVS